MDRSRYRSPFGARFGEEYFAPLRGAMERVFHELAQEFPQPSAGPAGGFLTPKVDVSETETAYELSVELPGVQPDDIAVDIADGVLTLKAERRQASEQTDEKRQFHLVERAHGVFLRRFTLPFAVDEAAVEARFQHGVLHLRAPRAKPTEPPSRRIPIKSE